MATVMFAETLQKPPSFDAAYSLKPKLYIELQPRKPKNKNLLVHNLFKTQWYNMHDLF
jgi:hypothetical protein